LGLGLLMMLWCGGKLKNKRITATNSVKITVMIDDKNSVVIAINTVG
jgi:hypothetical protein